MSATFPAWSLHASIPRTARLPNIKVTFAQIANVVGQSTLLKTNGLSLLLELALLGSFLDALQCSRSTYPISWSHIPYDYMLHRWYNESFGHLCSLLIWGCLKPCRCGMRKHTANINGNVPPRQPKKLPVRHHLKHAHWTRTSLPARVLPPPFRGKKRLRKSSHSNQFLWLNPKEASFGILYLTVRQVEDDYQEWCECTNVI